MGANMQRQALPLLRAEAPLVATGVEAQAAKDSGIADVILNSKMQDSHAVATLCGLRGVVISATCRQRIGA